MERVKRLLLPLDGSECSLTALPVAASLAKTYEADVFVFGCIDLNDLIGSGAGMSPGNFNSLLTESEMAIKSFINEAVEKLRAQGLNAVARVASGQPVDTILKCAEEEEIDLIAMASHGRSGLKRFILGSITEGVLRRSKCPVLVLPVHDHSD